MAVGLLCLPYSIASGVTCRPPAHTDIKVGRLRYVDIPGHAPILYVPR